MKGKNNNNKKVRFYTNLSKKIFLSLFFKLFLLCIDQSSGGAGSAAAALYTTALLSGRFWQRSRESIIYCSSSPSVMPPIGWQ